MCSDIKYHISTKFLVYWLAFGFLLMPLVAFSQTLNSRPKSETPGEQTKMNAEDGCQKLFQKYILPLQELWRKKAAELKADNTDGYAIVEDLTQEHCRETDTRTELISLLSRILNVHTGKIAVILPISKYPYLRTVIGAFEAHATTLGKDPKKLFVIYDTEEKNDKLVQAIASSVFEQKVTAIIGGSEPSEAEMLISWSNRLMIPTFILSEPKSKPIGSQVFYAHPTQRSLALALVAGNTKFGHKKISILAPSDQRNARFVSAYSEAAKSAGLTIEHQISYDPRRFDSMEAAAKKIFKLDGTDRRDELKKLYETAKQHAKETGTKFNPKMIALQPDVQQDAVMIADSFRIVRHFAKLFVFLGVRRIPLFGHFEWRSKGLVSPWDPFLNHGYFVDFQGLYSDMPESIRIQGSESPIFASNDKIEQADFSLLGWRAIAVPLMLAQNKHEPRRKLDRLVPRKTTTSSTIAYDQDNTMIGEGFLFRLTGTGNVGNASLVTP